MVKERQRGVAARLGRPFWIALGGLALAVGAIGVVLPVLPTTPFVLLAAFCFAKASPKLAARLETHAIFGPIIADWRTHGAIARRYKRIAIVMMVAALALSLVLQLSVWVIVLQATAIAAASLYILSRPDGPGR